jgi:hypothetical protein
MRKIEEKTNSPKINLGDDYDEEGEFLDAFSPKKEEKPIQKSKQDEVLGIDTKAV